MEQRNLLSVGFAILVIAVGMLFFIEKNNDHVECQTITKTTTDAHGMKMVEEEHLCLERFSI